MIAFVVLHSMQFWMMCSDIDMLDGFVKLIRRLYPKPQGQDLKCYCGNTCKMKVSAVVLDV
jgi:hypothetical protein